MSSSFLMILREWSRKSCFRVTRSPQSGLAPQSQTAFAEGTGGFNPLTMSLQSQTALVEGAGGFNPLTMSPKRRGLQARPSASKTRYSCSTRRLRKNPSARIGGGFVSGHDFTGSGNPISSRLCVSARPRYPLGRMPQVLHNQRLALQAAEELFVVNIQELCNKGTTLVGPIKPMK